MLLTSAAALSLALGSAFSLATFTGADLASAAVQRAKSLSDLLNARSPGERTQGQLSNTKHKQALLAEREAGPADVKEPLKNLAELLAPAGPPSVNLDATPYIPEFGLVSLPTVFSPPPGGLVIPPTGVTPGGPGGPPGQPPEIPPPNQPPPVSPPPLPEPGTWMMMILGFAMVGQALRRDAAAVRRLES